jgi:Peptidase S46
LKGRYQFELTDVWLDQVRLASLRFAEGGSGSFVSPDGLILTNHHVINRVIDDMSTAGRDYVRDGFLALSREHEVRCPNLEVQVLVGIEDVTRRVEAALKPGMAPAEAAKARRSMFCALEKEAAVSPGLTGEVVPLFEGERYHLYRYKTYTDVRLVFAPETWIATLYDICFLRAYEGGKPARVEHYLKCSRDEPREGELVFMAGCPNISRRHLTVAEIQILRDRQGRNSRLRARRMRILDEHRALGGDNISRTEVEYFHTSWAKTISEEEFRLLLPGSELMRRREIREASIRAAVHKDPWLQEAYGGAWQRLAELSERKDRVERSYELLEGGEAFDGRLFDFARVLVRLADETAKPNAERLEAYSEANLPSLERWLFAELPIHEELEIRKLADSLTMFEEEAGSNNELVRKVLAGKRPVDRAIELVRDSRLGDVKVRRALAEGGQRAINTSKDPMIALVRLVDAPARKLRSDVDDDIGERVYREHLRITAAVRAVSGPDAYPDATGTLRLSFGQVAKHDSQTQSDSIYWTLTDLSWSLRERPPIAPSQIRSALEPRSLRVRSGLKFDTPFLFESEVDGSWGNSGSPVLNRRGEQIGVLSRGPRESLYLMYEYDSQRSREMVVHMAGIVEVLVNVYGALELERELTAGE